MAAKKKTGSIKRSVKLISLSRQDLSQKEREQKLPIQA